MPFVRIWCSNLCCRESGHEHHCTFNNILQNEIVQCDSWNDNEGTSGQPWFEYKEQRGWAWPKKNRVAMQPQIATSLSLNFWKYMFISVGLSFWFEYCVLIKKAHNFTYGIVQGSKLMLEVLLMDNLGSCYKSRQYKSIAVGLNASTQHWRWTIGNMMIIILSKFNSLGG